MKYHLLLVVFLIGLVSIVAPKNRNNLAHKHFSNVLQQIKSRQIKNLQTIREWDRENFYSKVHKKNTINRKSSSVIYRPAKVTTNDFENSNFASSIVRYTYDNSGNCLTLLSEQINNGLKTNDARVSYTYDNSGNCITELQEGWDDSTWLNLVKYTFTYDNTGNFLTQIEEEWNDSVKAWMNSSRISKTYDESGNWALEVGDLWSESKNDWEIYVKYIAGYDTAGNLISQTTLFSVDGVLGNFLRELSTYDENGNRLEWNFEYWRNNKWNKYGRYIYTYNNSGQWLTRNIETWVEKTGAWKSDIKENAEYNNSGSITGELIEEWSDIEWKNLYKLVYNYDENNNAIHGESFAWKDSSWVYEPGDLNLYYENNNRSVYSFSAVADVEYIAISPTGISEEKINLLSFKLEQNFPNPFNPVTVISYQLSVNSHTIIKVYDVLGNEVAMLVNEQKQPGYYQVKFDGSNLSSGVYFYRIDAGEFSSTKKLLLMK